VANPILPEVFVTKWALTRGIVSFRNVEHCLEASPDGKMVAVPVLGSYQECFHGKDWHLSLKSARAQVSQTIAKRRRSLERSLKQLPKSAEEVPVVNG